MMASTCTTPKSTPFDAQMTERFHEPTLSHLERVTHALGVLRAHVAQAHPQLVLAVTVWRHKVVVVHARREMLRGLSEVTDRFQEIDVFFPMRRIILQIPARSCLLYTSPSPRD